MFSINGGYKQNIESNKKTRPKKVHSIIPLHIFQTWKTTKMPPSMFENVKLLKRQNPEFTHYIYDDKMCRDFIEKHFHNDVLYSYDKLRPGAYRADLWRYCVLYINGGIYLDIKFHCVNDFKLIYLTDKEYFVRDRDHCGSIGVYQGFMSCLPKTKLLKNAIDTIVENVKNNKYGFGELDITGPHMLNAFFYGPMVHDFELGFHGTHITQNDQSIIKEYPQYRDDQQDLFNNAVILNQHDKYYKTYWNEKDVYNYPVLESDQTIDLNKIVTQNIYYKNQPLFAGTPTIIEVPGNQYIVNVRWVNYSYNDDGSKTNIPKQWVSLNSRFVLNDKFQKITNETFLEEQFSNEKNYLGMGLEDIRIFHYSDRYFYIASYFDERRKLTSISSYFYDIHSKNYKLKRNIIKPEMYDLDNIKLYEKNWALFEYKKKICVVYNWYPLQIGRMYYLKNSMNVTENKYDMPDFFKEVRGSSCGYQKNDEIWFVAHKGQNYGNEQNNICYHYQHFFVIFDLDMNLLRYSELFKLGQCKVEFCTGLIVKDDEIILSYSLMDTQSFISIYNMDYIKDKIKWYEHI